MRPKTKKFMIESNNDRKRLLILSMPFGSGHLKAGEALAATCRDKFDCEVYHLNYLDCIDPKLTKSVQRGYHWMVKYFPFLNKWAYYGFNKPNEKLKKVGETFNVKEYAEVMEQYKPDMILSTHYIPAMLSSWMYRNYPVPNGVVITDYDFNSMWVYPNNSKVFIACKQMLKDMKKCGVDESRVVVSGIPVRKEFYKEFDKAELRKKLKIGAEENVLLLMSGGTATGPFLEILKSLAELRDRIYLLVVTGHNEKLAGDISEAFTQMNLKGKVMTFVDNVEEYMGAADLLVSKAGGLTITEAITIGLPILVIRPTPGQEDGNTRFIVNGGAGIYIKNPKSINLVVKDLINDSERLKRMSAKAKGLSKPDAAENILKEMLELAEKESREECI